MDGDLMLSQSLRRPAVRYFRATGWSRSRRPVSGFSPLYPGSRSTSIVLAPLLWTLPHSCGGICRDEPSIRCGCRQSAGEDPDVEQAGPQHQTNYQPQSSRPAPGARPAFAPSRVRTTCAPSQEARIAWVKRRVSERMTTFTWTAQEWEISHYPWSESRAAPARPPRPRSVHATERRVDSGYARYGRLPLAP